MSVAFFFVWNCFSYIYSCFFFSDDNRPACSVTTVRDDEIENVDMDLEDSDFEPGADTELLGLFFPEVCIYN